MIEDEGHGKTMDHGQRTTDDGPRTIDDGGWPTAMGMDERTTGRRTGHDRQGEQGLTAGTAVGLFSYILVFSWRFFPWCAKRERVFCPYICMEAKNEIPVRVFREMR